jgi:hypothetical protein
MQSVSSDVSVQILNSINTHLAKEFEKIFSAPYHGDTYYDNATREQEISQWADKVHPQTTRQPLAASDAASKEGVDLGSCLLFGATILGALVGTLSITKPSQIRVISDLPIYNDEPMIEEQVRSV